MRWKPILHALAYSLSAAAVLPLVLLCMVHGRIGIGYVYRDYGFLLSLIPTPVGLQIRRAFYRMTLRRCGRGLEVGPGSYFVYRETEVGDHFACGNYCIIGLSTIGDYVMLGSRVSILSGLQQHGSADPDVPMRLQAGRRQRVRLGSDIWIGEGAIVASDVGDHCIIGVGAVITKPAPESGIFMGNPARVVGQRRPDATAQGPGLRPANADRLPGSGPPP